uniref:Uncharacterized protein n=1 Tax=Cacopsylla melanoneura TaxID=428564 RepID=A0A8D9AYA4_9HEMI
MGYLFLALLLISCVYTLLRANKCHEDYKESVRKPKMKNVLMEGPAQLNEDYCKDCLRRIRREAENKKWGTWSEERKRKRSEQVKAYWRKLKGDGLTHRSKTPSIKRWTWSNKSKEKKRKHMKQFWQKQKETGGERLKKHSLVMREMIRNYTQISGNHSETIKQYWRIRKEEGRTNCPEKHSAQMKAYWRKKKDDGNTERERKISEKVKAFYRRQKELGITDHERMMRVSRGMLKYWQKMKDAGNVSRLKAMSSRMKEFWNGGDRRGEHSELMSEFWRQEKEEFSMYWTKYGSYSKERDMREIFLKFWRRQDRETGTDRRQALSMKLKEYWVGAHKNETRTTSLEPAPTNYTNSRKIYKSILHY